MEDYTGLCGNNNGNSKDDWLMPTPSLPGSYGFLSGSSGAMAGSAEQLFNSWKDPDHDCQVKNSTYRSQLKTLINGREYHSSNNYTGEIEYFLY
jgi:hypothetical protein